MPKTAVIRVTHSCHLIEIGDHVRAFISAIPALSTDGPGSLVQLNEIAIPDAVPGPLT
jgi:hypothetical protein